MLVPSHNTNAGVVTMHASELGAFLDVPDLNFSRAEANADICSIAGPLDTADIGVWAGFQERADGARLCRPDIDIALETNSDLVTGGPVEKVEVVVIDKTRSIQDTFWSGGDATSKLRGCGIGILERAVVLGSKVDWLR